MFVANCERADAKSRAKGAKGEPAGVQVTWEQPEELEAYIGKLQEVAGRLADENRKLRKQHSLICDKVRLLSIDSTVYEHCTLRIIFPVTMPCVQVVALMSTDLLRSQQRWKDTCMEVRKTMADLQQQYGFSSDNMRPWRAHFDRQLYKVRTRTRHIVSASFSNKTESSYLLLYLQALDHQFALCLEVLNEQLPDIRVDVTLRQSHLVFKYASAICSFDYKQYHMDSCAVHVVRRWRSCAPSTTRRCGGSCSCPQCSAASASRARTSSSRSSSSATRPA